MKSDTKLVNEFNRSNTINFIVRPNHFNLNISIYKINENDCIVECTHSSKGWEGHDISIFIKYINNVPFSYHLNYQKDIKIDKYLVLSNINTFNEDINKIKKENKFVFKEYHNIISYARGYIKDFFL